MDLISIIGTTLNSAASLVELANKIKNQELLNKIAELNLQIATVQCGSAELLRENSSLKNEIEILKDDKANPLKYNPDDGLYYDTETNNPYCPNCYEGGKKERRHLRVDYEQCTYCNTNYKKRSAGNNYTSWDPLED